MSEIIDKFLEKCATTLEDWKFWKEEHKLSDRLIVAGPSRIIALLDIPKLEEEIEWTPYTPISKPSKKMSGCFAYGKHIYSIYFLRDDVFEFLGESVEIGTYAGAVMVFKLTETIALGLSPKLMEDGFYFNDEGVMFVDEDWGDEDLNKDLNDAKEEFIKWEDGVAKRKHSGGNVGDWYEEVYQFEKFFELEEEMGDFLDI